MVPQGRLHTKIPALVLQKRAPWLFFVLQEACCSSSTGCKMKSLSGTWSQYLSGLELCSSMASTTTDNDVHDDPPTRSMWSLQHLARRKIQLVLAKTERGYSSTNQQRSEQLPIPPLLRRVVARDAFILEEVSWDHLCLGLGGWEVLESTRLPTSQTPSRASVTSEVSEIPTSSSQDKPEEGSMFGFNINPTEVFRPQLAPKANDNLHVRNARRPAVQKQD